MCVHFEWVWPQYLARSHFGLADAIREWIKFGAVLGRTFMQACMLA